ncbi:programmed cell death protein 7 [Nilaparvata lugens]|uniref:programmed cell death protein 7 n=1 Tax=Nilaparvata lugens TaxID=108931 RepID=UPI00193E36A6|nr:programmed cell death protein 7 [Nilaparvata lugens]
MKMSNYRENTSNEGYFNIPPPPLPPMNMPPYGMAPFNGGLANYPTPNQLPFNDGLAQLHANFPYFPSQDSQPMMGQHGFLSSLPPPTFHPSPSSSFSRPPIVQPTEDEEKEKDRTWIKNWLRNIGKENKMSAEKPVASDNIKISEIKYKVMKIKKLTSELESMSKSLAVMMKTLNEEEWKERVEEIEDKKRDLTDLLGELNNKREIVKRQLDKRIRKRNRERKKRVERRMVKEERRVGSERENERIDVWMREMEESVERARREAEMKREADSVLSDVTRKKNEAKRQLALFEGLRKLHKARVVAWNAMGLIISSAQLDTFSNVVDRLAAMWSDRLNEYNLEERGLKVMLQEASDDVTAMSTNRQKQILRQWESALFGSAANCHQPKDVHEFTAVRKHWDEFVVPEESFTSSSIPAGWIIPCQPSSENWRKFLHDKIH